MSSIKLLDETLNWLKESYRDKIFYTERDIVYLFQRDLNKRVKREGKKEGKKEDEMVKIYSEYTMQNRQRADLVVMEDAKSDKVDIAVEFKYEPDHARKGDDIRASKFPVVSWKEVEKDIVKVEKYTMKHVEKNIEPVNHAYSIFIDEGKHYAPKYKKKWKKWKGMKGEVAVLITEFHKK